MDLTFLNNYSSERRVVVWILRGDGKDFPTQPCKYILLGKIKWLSMWFTKFTPYHRIRISLTCRSGLYKLQWILYLDNSIIWYLFPYSWGIKRYKERISKKHSQGKDTMEMQIQCHQGWRNFLKFTHPSCLREFQDSNTYFD